ncbi:MAG: transposase [Clostridiaceae bacterium]|jgi:transposase-like protein|nr:transposase [Clostridiaceae bacterium]
MIKSKSNDNSVLSHFISLRHGVQRICPRCGSSYTVLYGKSRGKQRYMCKGCRRTFNDFTNTPIAKTHFPEKWEIFIKCTIEGLSLKAAACQVNVSYVTLFYWRHKLLSALKEIKQNKMQGSFELENFFLKYSRKGKKHIEHNEKRMHDQSVSFFNISNRKVCVVTALDTHKNIYSRAVGTGRMNAKDTEDYIGKILNKNKQVCSRPKNFFAMFFKRMNIKECNKFLDDSSVAVKYRCHCMEWLYRFKGVATKYLNNYLSLFKFLKEINFCKEFWSVRKFITDIAGINVENTYINIREAEVCFI